MTNIQIDDAVAAALGKQADALGVSLEDYLRQLAEHASLVAPSQPLSGEALERLISEEATGDVAIPGTFTREDIYREHA